MAEGNGELVKLKASIVSKKLIALLAVLGVSLILAFTGKLTTDSLSQILLTSVIGYFGAQGAVDLGKTISDMVAKRNGAGNGTTGQG
jgi:uncharacterized membrane protein